MTDIENLDNFIEELAEKGILTNDEKPKYLEMLGQGQLSETKQQLYNLLREKLLENEVQIFEDILGYAAALKDMAEKTGDPELLQIAEELDSSLAAQLQTFNEQMDILSSEYQGLTP